MIAVRLSDHRVVAYRAGCTHAQCIVSFDPGRGLITCPCHGAEFDPGHGAAVVSGPAPRPLPQVPVTVEPDGSVYVQV